MTPQEAAEIIKQHNAWRRCGGIIDMPYSSKIVGEAIDVILKYYHETQSIKKEHEEHS